MTPTPYYSDDLVTLYHADALNLDAWTAADVLVTDPPYGIAYTSGREGALPRSIAGDDDTSTRDALLALWRATHGEDAPALVFGTWRRPAPTGTRMKLVWDTKGALGMGALDLPWKPAHQEVYVLGRGFRGRRGSDVITCAPVQSTAANGRTHPHEKPVPLLAALIAKCPPGTIADPCAGTGSTLVAAKLAGRPAIGVELDERYAEQAARRLAQDALDLGALAP